VRFAVLPKQKVVSPIAVTVGTPFTVSIKFLLLVHPFCPVETTV
jgi:hypothetical protein